ncbi:hypothetical protein [Oceanobacillus salinisoli]|uniref:hypothetical protein n=1 Tax=Oceanobacillus salinisoli TaxID=2678611 RepID=UPI001E5F01DA|nr:hypothetical protein [Oceanobacillus salinisoli]
MNLIELYCPICQQQVEGNDKVVLDTINTITHKTCFNLEFALKDYGTFEEMVKRYEFFKCED